MSDHYVGVDGGGSRTRALLTREDGSEVVRVEGPPSLVDPSRPETSAGVVARLVREAAAEAGVPLPVRGLFAGLAGAGREPVRSAVEVALREGGVAEKVRVDTDVRASFHDAFGEGPGVLLLAGTGSMAWGRGEHGREARVGGWGALLGDEGSGYRIGLEALRAVVRSADGREESTALTEAVLEELGLDAPEELVGWASGAEKAAVAGLVPIVLRCSVGGDAPADAILAEAVRELEDHVLTLVDRLGPWTAEPPVALAGGLLEPGRPLRSRVEAALARHPVRWSEGEPDALRGAVALARESE